MREGAQVEKGVRDSHGKAYGQKREWHGCAGRHVMVVSIL